MARGISPETNEGASLGSSAKNWANLFTKNITLSNNFDLTGSAIVAKTLRENGYIKYASGLILQWGAVDMTQQATTKTVELPVSFPNRGITGCAGSMDVNRVSPCGVTVSQSSITIKTTAASSWTNWFAIGY
jgi:hypothetical protein